MSKKVLLSYSAGLFSTLLLAPMAGWAQDGSGPKEPVKSDWAFALGAGVNYSPDYEGSDDYEVGALPLFDVTWKDKLSFGTIGDLGLKLKTVEIKGPTPRDNLIVTTSLGYFMGRDEGDNDALQGLGDLDGNLTGGLGIEYNYGSFSLSAELQQDLGGDREGTLMTAGLDYKIPILTERTFLSVGPQLSWASDDYMQTMFGITSAQAASSQQNYTAYSAEAGLKDFGLGASVMHQMTENISLMMTADYTQLTGDAADSPIVKDHGDDNQFSIGFGIMYSW